MNNPYSPTLASQNVPNPPLLKTLLQRFVAIFLYMVGWIFVGIISVALLNWIAGEVPQASTPEVELTSVQSFQRFCAHYWFTAFVFLSPPVCFAIWLLLRWNGFQKTRWMLLGLGLTISPVLLVVAWLLFRGLLFR